MHAVFLNPGFPAIIAHADDLFPAGYAGIEWHPCHASYQMFFPVSTLPIWTQLCSTRLAPLCFCLGSFLFGFGSGKTSSFSPFLSPSTG